MTVEDRIDDDIIKNLEYQFREGLPLTGIDGIYDADKREAWQKRAASDGGQGLSKTHRQNRDATLKSAISTKTQETTGTTDKTVGYQIGLYNAKNLYNQYYHGSFNQFKTNEERHQYALEKTLSAINDSTYDVGVKNGTGVFEMQGPANTMVYGQKIESSRKYIHDYASENEGDINIIFTSIIPDTENELLKLDNYAKDPTRSKIPVFYNQLAGELRTPGVTGWHIANAQYFAKYGKELPRPQIIDDLHNKSPLIQYMYTYYPNQRRLLRAQKMENNESFNTTNPWR